MIVLRAFSDDSQGELHSEAGFDGEIETFPVNLARGRNKTFAGLLRRRQLFGFLTGVRLTFVLFYFFARCGKGGCGKLFHGDRRRDNDRFPAVSLFYFFGGVSRDRDKGIRAL